MVSYTYDQLRRRAGWSATSGGGSFESYTYDSKDRLATVTSGLGISPFTYAYDGTSTRVTGITGGMVGISYTYLSTTQDKRLDQITQTAMGLGTISMDKYTYDAVGNIKTWKQQRGSGATVMRWDLGYDAADQLTNWTQRVDSTNTLSAQYSNRYDLVGNWRATQNSAGVSTALHNSVNELTSLTAGGTLSLEGTLSEPATVTIQGVPATVDGTNTYRGTASIVPGANSFPIVAKDANNNTTTKYVHITVPVTGASFSYDENGNMIEDGMFTYEWDAENRLVALNKISTSQRTEFSYDGWSRCTRIVEKTGGVGGTVTSNLQYLWDGMKRIQSRNSTGATVQRNYFDLGFTSGTNRYYYAKDHLGSITALVNNSSSVVGQWTYDLWGTRNSLSVTVDSDFGFTGFMNHWSGLQMAPFRFYTPTYGRWLSRDPIGERGGINLYGYVSNNPAFWIDPLGLHGGAGGRPGVCTGGDLGDQLNDLGNFIFGPEGWGSMDALGMEMAVSSFTSSLLSKLPHFEPPPTRNSNPFSGEPGSEVSCKNSKGDLKQHGATVKMGTPIKIPIGITIMDRASHMCMNGGVPKAGASPQNKIGGKAIRLSRAILEFNKYDGVRTSVLSRW